jgi:hypothetical protein
MITITVTEEVIQTNVQAIVEQMLNEKSSYSNPIKQLAEKQLNHDGPLRDALKAKIDKLLKEIIESPTHDAVVGAAIVQEMAKRQIEEMQKKKGY